MKFFKFIVRKFVKGNCWEYTDFNYVIPATLMKSLRYYESTDEEDRYYCDFLLTFDGFDGEVSTLVCSKETLETYLNFCTNQCDDNILNLGIVEVVKDYESIFKEEYYDE